MSLISPPLLSIPSITSSPPILGTPDTFEEILPAGTIGSPVIFLKISLSTPNSLTISDEKYSNPQPKSVLKMPK